MIHDIKHSPLNESKNHYKLANNFILTFSYSQQVYSRIRRMEKCALGYEERIHIRPYLSIISYHTSLKILLLTEYLAMQLYNLQNKKCLLITSQHSIAQCQLLNDSAPLTAITFCHKCSIGKELIIFNLLLYFLIILTNL